MNSTSDKYESIYSLLSDTAEEVPDQVAITYIESIEPSICDRKLRFTEFSKWMNQIARLLHREFGGERQVVGLLLPNIPVSQAILWGGSAVATVQPLNLLLDEDMLVGLLDSSRAKALVAIGPQVSEALWEKALNVATRVDSIDSVFCVQDEEDGQGHRNFNVEVGRESASALPEDWLPRSNDIATLFHTGGTTGVPKIAMLSHRNHIVSACTFGQYSGLSSGESVANGLPIFHIAGSNIAGLALLAKGINVILPTIEGFRNPEVINHYWRLVERYKIVSNMCVPTSMASILEIPVGNTDIASLRMNVSGGAIVPDALTERAQKVTGRPLLQMYGMTEGSGLAALAAPHVENVIGCAGWVPPEVEIRIGAGGSCAQQVGEIHIRSDAVFCGYLNSPQNPVDENGWLATGDLGYLDDQERLFICGRSKDLIIRSGHNIDPVIIEACLEKHPAVFLAAAVGRPDSYAGELPIAYVELRSGMNTTPEEILEFASENIDERPACPKQIVIVENLPLTAVGKIYKPRLRELAAEELVKEVLGNSCPGHDLVITASHNEYGILEIDVATGEHTQVLDRNAQSLASDFKLSVRVSGNRASK